MRFNGSIYDKHFAFSVHVEPKFRARRRLRLAMGIQGLLKALDPAIEKNVSVARFKGKKVVIDGFAWLHRG